MKILFSAAAALSLLLAPVTADAKPGQGRGNGHGARGEEGFCPPGLAKRDPACIPPGQVGREDRHDEVRRARENEEDRDAEEREVHVEPRERDAAAVLLDLLDDLPVRAAQPSDAAVLDVPPAPAPVLVEEPVVTPAPAPAALDPAADTGSGLAEIFRRATADGSVGY